jgi:hypothetical protein
LVVSRLLHKYSFDTHNCSKKIHKWALRFPWHRASDHGHPSWLVVSYKLHALAALPPPPPPGKRPCYQLYRRLCAHHRWSGLHGTQKILDPTRTRTPTFWLSSQEPVAIPTALSQLSKLVLFLTQSSYDVHQINHVVTSVV